jgi:hypothetical protein
VNDTPPEVDELYRCMLLRLYAEDLPDDRLRERAVRAVEGWRAR